MANTLGAYNPTFYAQEALIWLRKALGMANRVYMGYDEERRTFNKGDTITIRRPATFTAQPAPSTAQDLATESVSILLNQWYEVKYALTDKEHAYTQERIINEHVMPAAYAIADNIDLALAALAVTVPHAYVEASSGTAATVAGIVGARAKMFDQKVPLNNPNMVNFMVGGKEWADLITLANFSQFQGAGSAGVATQTSGDLGPKYGMGFFANQNRPTVVYANITDFAGATTAAALKGATSLAVGSLGAAEVYKKGTIIKMTSGTDLGSEYAIAADATMSGGALTITINPGARNAIGSGDTFSAGVTQGEGTPNQDNKTNNVNLAFHRDWAALAFAKLPDFREYPNQLGIASTSIQDPVTGLSLRYRIFYDGDSSKMFAAVDVLYGVKELNADLAVRYEILNA